MLGDMDDVVGEEGKSVEWTPAGDLVKMSSGALPTPSILSPTLSLFAMIEGLYG